MKQRPLGVHVCPVCGKLIDLDTKYAIDHMTSDKHHVDHLLKAKEFLNRNGATDTKYVDAMSSSHQQ